jgi:hypothetical protein
VYGGWHHRPRTHTDLESLLAAHAAAAEDDDAPAAEPTEQRDRPPQKNTAVPTQR